VSPDQLSPEWLASKPPIVVLVSVLLAALVWALRELRSCRQRNEQLSDYLVEHLERDSSERLTLINRLGTVSRQRSVR
jgi:hypothetical protein